MTWSPHWLVTLAGTMYGSPGVDVFSCNIRMHPVTVSGFNEDTYLNEISGPLNTFWTTAANKIGTYAWLTTLKCNHIDTNGKYSDPGVSHIKNVTPAQGASTTNYPGVTSVCWSWTTIKTRGYAHTGRIYPPVGIASADLQTPGGMLLTSTAQNAHITAAKALLSVLKNSAGTMPVVPGVYSGHSNEVQDITGVRIGSVIDLQRRRKNAIPETYVNAAWP